MSNLYGFKLSLKRTVHLFKLNTQRNLLKLRIFFYFKLLDVYASFLYIILVAGNLCSLISAIATDVLIKPEDDDKIREYIENFMEKSEDYLRRIGEKEIDKAYELKLQLALLTYVVKKISE